MFPPTYLQEPNIWKNGKGSFMFFLLTVFLFCVSGCDLAEPDPLPPRGDEAIIEKAREHIQAERDDDESDDCKVKKTFYKDADGDGFGDPKSSSKACKAPPGYVDNAEDCYDKNPDVHPKQKSYFHVHRGDGSFDYDCDGKEKRRIMDRAFCRLKEDESGCFYASGWNQSKIPQCGEAGNWKWHECSEIHHIVTPQASNDDTGEGTSGGSSTTNGDSTGDGAEPAKKKRPAISRQKPAKKTEQEEDDGKPRTLPTNVKYRCRGNELPWKKMQLCR